jgi:hypothetical protein
MTTPASQTQNQTSHVHSIEEIIIIKGWTLIFLLSNKHNSHDQQDEQAQDDKPRTDDG